LFVYIFGQLQPLTIKLFYRGSVVFGGILYFSAIFELFITQRWAIKGKLLQNPLWRTFSRYLLFKY